MRTKSARWSSWRRLRKAGLFATEGLILGAVQRRLLRHNGPEHALVVGTTQSRKTTSVVIPNLLTWQHSVITHDPKNELFLVTAGWRGTMSRVVRLAPTESTSQCYNLLDGIALKTDQEIRGVQLVSEMLTDVRGAGGDSRSATSAHFIEMARIALNGLILYGLYTQRARSLGALRALYMSQSLAALGKTMARYPHQVVQEAGKVLTQTDGHEERSGIYSSVARALWVYSDPLIQRATDTSDFTLRDLRERARPMSLYLHVPFGDQERLRPWVRTVLRQCCDYCVSRPTGWPWKMLGMIDEVPAVKRLLFLSDGLNYVASYGFRLMLITPTMKEMAQTYGRDHHFLEGCGIKVVCGVRDREIADIFSGDLGEQEVKKQKRIGRQWVTERVREPLLSSTALMGLPPERALVMAGTEKVLVDKTYYLNDALLRARSQV